MQMAMWLSCGKKGEPNYIAKNLINLISIKHASKNISFCVSIICYRICLKRHCVLSISSILVTYKSLRAGCFVTVSFHVYNLCV